PQIHWRLNTWAWNSNAGWQNACNLGTSFGSAGLVLRETNGFANDRRSATVASLPEVMTDPHGSESVRTRRRGRDRPAQLRRDVDGGKGRGLEARDRQRSRPPSLVEPPHPERRESADGGQQVFRLRLDFYQLRAGQRLDWRSQLHPVPHFDQL